MKKEKLYEELQKKVYKIISPTSYLNNFDHHLTLQDIFIAITESHKKKIPQP